MKDPGWAGSSVSRHSRSLGVHPQFHTLGVLTSIPAKPASGWAEGGGSETQLLLSYIVWASLGSVRLSCLRKRKEREDGSENTFDG